VGLRELWRFGQADKRKALPQIAEYEACEACINILMGAVQHVLCCCIVKV
jgi:hypothetical protein